MRSRRSRVRDQRWAGRWAFARLAVSLESGGSRRSTAGAVG